METGKVGKIGALILVIVLAIAYTARPYVSDYLRERTAMSQGGGYPGGGGPGGGMNPQQMMQRRLEQMTQTLKLTPDQQAKIKAIQESAAPRMNAIRQNNALSRQQKGEQMRPIRDETQTQIKAVLTPEQIPQYDTMLAQMRARFGGGRPGGRPGGGGPGPGGGGAPGARPGGAPGGP